jgi:hypothetical protein
MADAARQLPDARPRKPPGPAWRRAYNAVEHNVTAPMVTVTGSEVFADSLAVIARARATYLRMIERRSRQLLHLWNLPAASDLRRLHEQVAALQRQIADLELRLRDGDGSR